MKVAWELFLICMDWEQMESRISRWVGCFRCKAYDDDHGPGFDRRWPTC